MKKIFLSSSEKETKKIAADIASKTEITGDRATVITLSGDLGAGKTAFTKGFLAAMGVKYRVTSPTFVVSKRYSVKKRGFKNVYHFDCYRIRDPKELLVIGFKEILADRSNIILIEWPENAGRLSPSIRISISHMPTENERRLTVQSKTSFDF